MKTKKRHTMYMAFFLSYVLLLVITTSSLFVYYAQIRDAVTEETQKSKRALLSQLMDNVDQKMKYADNLMNGIASDNKLLQFARGSGSYTLENLLSDIQSTYKPDYLVNYSVYFSEMDEVVTPGFHMKAPEYFKYMYRPADIDYGAFVKKYLSGYKLRALGPVLHIQMIGGNKADVLPYVQTFPFSGKPAGQIVILIDAKEITNLITQLNESTSSHVYILGGDDSLMFSSAEAPALPGGVIGRLRQDGGRFQTEIGGERMVLMSVSSAQCGWRFVLAAPTNVYFKASLRFGTICVAIFAIYLVIGLLIGHFLAKRNYRPIKEISDIIKKYVSEESRAENGNDFGAIKHVLIDRLSTDRKLSEIIQAQRPLVSQAYLLSLLRGIEVHYQDAQARLDSLGIRFPSDRFTAAVLEFDPDSPFFMEEARFPEDNYSLARVAVQNIGSELFGKAFRCFFLDLDRGRFLFLLSAEEALPPEESADRLKRDILRLNGFIGSNFRLGITWGFSSQHEGLKNLPKCYDEAKKALESGRKSPDGVACFADVRDIDSDYFFPTEIEYQVVDLLKNGNYPEGKALLENIFKINESALRGSRVSRRFLAQVAAMLARSMNGILSAKGKPPLSARTLLDGLGEKPTLKSSRTYFLSFIDQIAEEAQNQVFRKTELLVNRITDFIHRNVEGNLLDLNCIAEEFHITPQYVSNIFKKYKRENIKDYISRLKLDRAKELLLETDLSNYEISVRLGYVNELGVFRLFKKYERMTPGQYRTAHRKPAGPAKDATDP